MSVIIKNTTGSDILVTDVGITVPASSQITMNEANRYLWAQSDDLVTNVGSGDIVINDGTNDLNGSDGLDLIKGYQQKLVTESGRILTAENRIPSGYTVYVTGEADDITNGTYGGGTKLKFSSGTTSADFQLLNHYYIVGARVIWSLCDLDTYFDGTLIAPASSGFTNSTGDYDKVALGGGANMYKPVTAGTGAWTATLTDKLNANVNILKATPVPSAGNQGWFDYDADTNTITKNMTQTGGYNLFDFDVNLHSFGRKIWATPMDGGEGHLDISGVIGKKIFNSWKVKIDFAKDGGSLVAQLARVKFIVGAKGNI